MSAFLVGDTVNTVKLEEFSAALKAAYANGSARGGSMDWSDVQLALSLAIDALGDEAKAFMEAAAEGFDEEPSMSLPKDASPDVRSAAHLLFAYRYPDAVEWEDIDLAWEMLAASESAPAPRP